jgi:light-regulated signal transduction histidine kinase (bacteriophytochrome)
MLEAEPKILWTEVTKFIDQLNHDLRNHLNAVELQTAYLSEIVAEPEANCEIKRLREMTGKMSVQLQKLSASLARVQPTLMRYLAVEFVEDLRARLALDQPELSAEVEWKISLGKEALEIDPQLLQEAFLELFRNASAHGRAEGALVFEARSAGDSFDFTLREPKVRFEGATENWGARPLGQVRHGHYGLGLFRARSIFEAHHGHFQAIFDSAPSVLRTTVTLPGLES